MAHPDGTPIWFELTTDDPDQAQDFYTNVLGWTVAVSPAPEHAGYRIASAAGGDGVGGIMRSPPGLHGPSGWMIYFATGDVDAMAGRVTQLGGAVQFGPMDIPHVGRFATVADPQGIAFQIMKGSGAEDSTAFRQVAPEGSGAVGHGVWIELATPDPDGALDFYGRLFGWSKQGAMPMGDAGDYTFIGTGEHSRPGAVMSSQRTGAAPGWNWYVHVVDIDAAIDRTKSSGGRILQEPMQIPGGSYSANVEDTQGSRIGLVGPRRPKDEP